MVGCGVSPGDATATIVHGTVGSSGFCRIRATVAINSASVMVELVAMATIWSKCGFGS